MQLRKDLYHCFVGGRSIFLDLALNRYFALAKDLDETFQRILSDPDDIPGDAATLSKLFEAGILESTVDKAWYPEAQPWTMPQISLYEAAGPGSSSWWTIFKLVVQHLFVIAMLRRKPIKDVLERRAVRKLCLPSTTYDASARFSDIVSDVRACEKILSPHGRCLSSSILVFDELLRRGYKADLFFGVSNTPFAAHCWVQVDAMLVNDTLENVALYTPLLRI